MTLFYYVSENTFGDTKLKKIDGGAGTADKIIGKGIDGNADSDAVIGIIGKEVSGIEEFETGAGNDSITLENSTITGNVNLIDAGNGDNTISLFSVDAASTEFTTIRGGDDKDTINLRDASVQRIGTIDAGDGENSIDISGIETSQIELIKGGDDKDTVNYNGDMLVSIGSMELGHGENTIEFQGTKEISITSITGGYGIDNYKISSTMGVAIGSIELFGGTNTLDFEGAQKVNIGSISQ